MRIADVIRTEPSSAGSGRTTAGYCLAILAIATAVIHFAVSGEHFQEYWMYGVFMLVVAWLQLCWAIAVVAMPARWMPWVLRAGAILNVGVIAVYVVTRTIGDVVGGPPGPPGLG
jgi:hypothetical protein